jgi:hypothetical protein
MARPLRATTSGPSRAFALGGEAGVIMRWSAERLGVWSLPTPDASGRTERPLPVVP